MSKPQNTIAVIDDDREIREAMEALLSASGYNTETFGSAEAFLLCASTCRAICLLVDIQLGDVSGVELARQLAADGFKFPIIFMTGNADTLMERQAFAAGCVAFLSKPFPTTTLIEAIEKAIG
jgi:FixJ family two-component response regulator